ncbi:putative phage tail protein [Paraburkholderia bannensis]|uniref:Putative phage tail protein n=1 Tax=Paraburkholderia bannensis TaxID=765414 RepID=A0A7W9U2Q8_9BURK|nr:MULTISPECIES: phage tail protein [Paraburkholderia]MBB3260010.1 putative phage tail protein [Paraburkholderia sp. WP4_3_2]MBB6105216.1 putative phage tail protein [Paraburkholderia bannensis]
MRISGAKGSSGATATESPDSLHSIAYAKVLDLISEGPIVGLVNGLQSVFLDGTPILNSDGSANFSNYSVDTRLGTIDQEYLPGFPAVENETAIGVALTSDAPWVRQVENTQLTAVRIRFGVPALQQQNTSTGDVTGYVVQYAIDVAVDGGSYSQVLTGAFDGKTTSLYERSVRIDLPTAETGWLVRVRRLTANAHTNSIQDTVNVEAITEIIDRKLRYPMSALVGMSFDARSFSSVPTRSYDVKGLIISVPSNYDPEQRTYSGTWDGTFKQAWTNNPAWVLYDLVTNDRYGGGRFVDASSLDKWTLYEIAQYCDVMVSDGKGGTEPRFTCNCVIQSQSDAFKVLQDLAGVFRGNAYWGAGTVLVTADMPSDPVYVYTQANVVGGQFSYVGSERKTRYTAAQISWNDPANQYQQAVEYVADDDGLARYGVVKAQITAFGTTSQGQAHRLGLWTLLTSRYETNTVSFQVGLDGTLSAPGEVIAVADANKAGRQTGGRVRSMNGATVVLDRSPTAAAGDLLTVIMPTGIAQKRTVQAVNGNTIKVTEAFDQNAVVGAVWMLESADLAAQLFRVVSIEESDDDGQITYTINATQYEPGKYDAIDNGAQIQVRPVTIIPPSVQPPPTNVRLSTYSYIDQGISKTNMVIAWDSASSAVNYVPEWRKDNGDWVPANQTGGLQVEVAGIYQGTYLARVRAENAMGVLSIPAYGTDTVLTGKTSPPPALASLKTTTQVFAIQLDWTFPADGSANDTQYVDVWYSKTNDRSTATRLSLYPYPQARAMLQGLAAGQSFFFWARLTDTSGNIGPWYPSGAGVNGQSSSDSTQILSYLTGQITKQQLGQDVLSPINAIPGIQQGVSDNASAISKETSDRIAAVTGEATARAKAISDEATARGAAITSEQQARQDADSSLSTRIDTVTAANGTNAAAIQTETKARTDADTALGQRIDTVVATAGANTTAISQEVTARTNADSALGQRIDAVTATSNGNTTAITQEATARASADTALGQRIDSVTATTNGNATAITQEQTARANADTALGQRIDAVTATANGNTTAITNESTARANADSALGTQISALSAQINVPMAGDNGGYAGATTVYAGVWSEQSARAEADLALAQKTDTVAAQMQSTINGVSAVLSAAVQTETQARIDADSAQASQITTVQAQANANAAAVQTVAQSYADLTGRVAASYTIKTQVTSGGRTYIASIGVGVDNSSGVVESSVLVAAQRFAILDNTGSTVQSPFIVQGGQVFLAQAFIGTGWIQSANIADVIQSTAVGANGQPRWKLDKNGTLTLNGANTGSGYLTLTDSTLLVYDNNNVLRVRLGLW